MEGLACKSFFILLSFTILANFVATILADSSNPSQDLLSTSTKPAVPHLSVISPTISPEVFEVTESMSSSEYDIINDTSSEYDGRYYADVENITDLDDPNPVVEVYETDRYTFTTVTDSRGTKLLHYGGWSALVVAIASLVFIVGYITWRTATNISRFSS